MFSLWYTLLSWREYKDAIWGKIAQKPQNEQSPAAEAIIPTVPTVKPEPTRIPVIDNKNKMPSPSVPKSIPQSPPKLIPLPQNIKTSSPEPVRPLPKASLDPPPKPPRSPSPHPMRSEAFDDIEFDSEETEEEEDEENSVIDSTIFNQKPVASTVKEFLSGEINNIEKDS